MQLINTVQNEAIMSNVGEIGEFRIRNSAKAFNILSSGLYANKIRAIVRELSTNAVDSHVAAGKSETPFDVHLPNQLEPWFSIRDYGTGLSHEQVINIYTTYFESTKTASNEFVGCLGLGSKSPFAYTDNFTVTAIKDGRKGIYTAFINEHGVPSIALMMEESTDEPSGVEVKFSVNDRWDFDKFRQEARNVYKWFKHRPVVSGSAEFKFADPEYSTKDIVPGVHYTSDHQASYAVMGNIAYPIEIPDADKSLGELRKLLNCGLVMEFAIGELDFQASREGLSYIPQTVAAIKAKLEAVNAQLAVHIAEEANKIENLWSRAAFLATKKESQLWGAAVLKYAVDTKLETWNSGRYHGLKMWALGVDDLSKDYNIVIRGFNKTRGNRTLSNIKTASVYPPGNPKDANGRYIFTVAWEIGVSEHTVFVVNDTKTGAGERAKYHFRQTQSGGNAYSHNVYVIEPADRTKAMKTDEFFKAICNPPADNIVKASSLMQKPRLASQFKDVTIMRLERRGGRRGYRAEEDMVWRDAGKADTFDNTKTYYYVPLSGFTMLSTKGYTSGRELYDDVNGLGGLYNGHIYGVRKSDIEDIKKRPNWKNFEEHIEQVLNGKDVRKILVSMAKSQLDNSEVLSYNNTKILPMIDANSPYAKVVGELADVEKFTGSTYAVQRLFRRFAPNKSFSTGDMVVRLQNDLNQLYQRYPLLKHISSYRVVVEDIAEYINLIDQKKGV